MTLAGSQGAVRVIRDILGDQQNTLCFIMSLGLGRGSEKCHKCQVLFEWPFRNVIDFVSLGNIKVS
jgi:hypothetical protein